MEIGDPANYVLPDVNCDFTKVTMTQTDDKNVKIQGAIGKPPTETFKVSATYMDGFKATCVSIINGGQAGAKVPFIYYVSTWIVWRSVNLECKF